jgi:glutamate-1-semialdehyde 2,1-aminomutase
MVNSLAANTDRDNPGGRVSRRIPSSGGIPQEAVRSMVPIPWNDLDALDAALEQHAGRVAALLMVPIDFNNGCIEPVDGYLQAATDRVHAAGGLMIFDEVISVLKVAGGSAQALYGVTPDLSAVSKALSSGVPLAGVVGKREYMHALLQPAPQGPIQGGTYAGSALGLAAAQATLDIVTSGRFHADLLDAADGFFNELQSVFARSPLPARVQWAGCMFHIYVGTRDPVTDYADMRALDPELARRFFNRCIDAGLYFHTDFSVSAAHERAMFDEVLEKIESIAAAGV